MRYKGTSHPPPLTRSLATDVTDDLDIEDLFIEGMVWCLSNLGGLMANTQPMPDPSVRSRWTAKDEADFNERRERRYRIMKENRAPLVELAQVYVDNVPSGPMPTCELIADFLVTNAQRVTELLKPFVEVAP